MDLCFAGPKAEALRQAHKQWSANQLGGDVNWELRTPAQFETATRFVRPEDMREAAHISADPSEYVDWLGECAALGFESIDLHNVGTDQRGFIETFGERVLPALRT